MSGMITLHVLCFAAARDVVGVGELSWSLGDGASVATLRDAMFARYPGLAGHARSLRFAVNGEYAGDALVLENGDEVAVIPPVAGG